MNGKAMCLLTRTDLSERAPCSGDVLHNVLQILIREANNLVSALWLLRYVSRSENGFGHFADVET